MARVNFREVRDRFRHIDGEFVDCSLSLPEGEPFFRVRFYAWWEHPLFVESQKNGTGWGFSDYSDGFRVMTIYPVGLRQFDVSTEMDATDIAFLPSHPLLWEYENEGEIFCNVELSPLQAVQMVDEVSRKLDWEWQDIGSLADAVGRTYRYGSASTFSLGRFPRTVYHAVREYLDRQSIPYFTPGEPKSQSLPVIFLCDESKIIAEDFEVDVPDFEHRPEWFAPSGERVRNLEN
ncbi:MAG TPA: hypothetical protein VG944_18485 [Fimbriimonas sp.]|nr:hypothetical protein [Fimbriimonas sp.]